MVSENQGYMYLKFFIHDVYGSLSKKKKYIIEYRVLGSVEDFWNKQPLFSLFS